MRGIMERSIVGRLVTVYLAISILATLAVGWATWLKGRELLREAAFVRLETASHQKEAALHEWVRERRRDMDVLTLLLAGDPSLRALGEGRRRVHPMLWAALSDFRAVQPDVLEILILSPKDGRVLASTTPQHVGGFRARSAFYLKGRVGPALEGVYPSPELLRPIITLSASVRGPEGRLLAVAAAHLGLSPIDGIIRSREGLGKTGGAFLVDAENLRISSAALARDAAAGRRSLGIRRALAGGSGRGMYRNEAGVPVLGVYRWLPAYRMALVTEMDQAEAFGPAGLLALRSVLTGLGVSLVLAFVVFLVSRRLARPVLAVTAAATAVAAGDLTAAAPATAHDELGQLGRAFNAMTADLRRLYARLEEAGRERGAILAGSSDGIAVAERNGAIVYHNPGMERIFNCPLPADGTPTLALLAECLFPDAAERRAFLDDIEADFARRDPPVRVFGFDQDGERRWCRLKVSPMPGGGRMVLNAQDLTDIKRSEEEARHRALHDQLTGLPNRQLFADRLEQALRRARRLHLTVGLLFIDLDRFKHLNDTYGHAYGDRVIVEMGRRLEACVRESDTVARHGGDEFLVVLPDLARLGDALAVAGKIRLQLYDPEPAEGVRFPGASIGLAGYPQDGGNRDELLAAADAAMYAAKRAGGNTVRLAGSPDSPAAG